MTTSHLRVGVRGRVQGVGFRYAACAEARRLGLAGWVRNQPDGSVALEVHGGTAPVDAFLAWLRRGPPAARVDGLEISEAPPADAAPGRGFVIL